jgi:hypothetical protein
MVLGSSASTNNTNLIILFEGSDIERKLIRVFSIAAYADSRTLHNVPKHLSSLLPYVAQSVIHLIVLLLVSTCMHNYSKKP